MKEAWEIEGKESIISRYERAVNYYNLICQKEIDECLKRRDLLVAQARKRIEESVWKNK